MEMTKCSLHQILQRATLKLDCFCLRRGNVCVSTNLTHSHVFNKWWLKRMVKIWFYCKWKTLSQFPTYIIHKYCARFTGNFRFYQQPPFFRSFCYISFHVSPARSVKITLQCLTYEFSVNFFAKDGDSILFNVILIMFFLYRIRRLCT